MDEAAFKKLTIEMRQEALKKGLAVELSVVGGSMLPFINSKDKIVIVDCDQKKIKCGDLIIYKTGSDNNIMIAHRFVRKIKGKDGYLFITKGDALRRYDQPIDSNLAIAKIVKIKKPHFIIFLDCPIGKIINLLMLFISLSRIVPAGMMLLRKIKYLAKVRLYLGTRPHPDTFSLNRGSVSTLRIDS